jgi:hypothetical protein
MSGPPPRDIDVRVVGDAPQRDLYTLGAAAGRELGQEVNITRVDPVAWLDQTHPHNTPRVNLRVGVGEGEDDRVRRHTTSNERVFPQGRTRVRRTTVAACVTPP